MKVILNEEQMRLLLNNMILENMTDEGRQLPKKAFQQVQNLTKNVGKDLYGDKYGLSDEYSSKKYQVAITNDGELATGLFSIGNAKLSDDTLIINFTSALGCPSLAMCPVTQKACYAVAGENRLPDVRRKNIKVQNLWREALRKAISGKSNDPIEKVFNIAKLYIETLNAKNSKGEYKYKKPLRFVRFNEAGDFPHQRILDAAARFAEFAKNYGIMCMAYTSNAKLDFTKVAEGTSLPIDKLIKINASREDISLTPGTTQQKFFATPMDFKELLSQNDKVESISDNEANKLICKSAIEGENGIKSIPQLTYGKWIGGEGWYYVCPCSFWKYNKDKAESLFYNKNGLTNDDVSNNDKARQNLRKLLSPSQKSELVRILNKIKSPCGVECAVCHDMEGGITPDGERVTNYAVLTSTHGSGAGNFDNEFAEFKRTGKDIDTKTGKLNTNVKWHNSEENPFGKETKYDDNV
jgi:hypothetical protein